MEEKGVKSGRSYRLAAPVPQAGGGHPPRIPSFGRLHRLRTVGPVRPDGEGPASLSASTVICGRSAFSRLFRKGKRELSHRQRSNGVLPASELPAGTAVSARKIFRRSVPAGHQPGRWIFRQSGNLPTFFRGMNLAFPKDGPVSRRKSCRIPDSAGFSCSGPAPALSTAASAFFTRVFVRGGRERRRVGRMPRTNFLSAFHHLLFC